MSKSNFHTHCPRAWVYDGDVGIEYGGTFLHKQDLLEFVRDFTENGGATANSHLVTYVHVMGHGDADNQYQFEQGAIFVRAEQKMPSDEDLMREFGWGHDALSSWKAHPHYWGQLMIDYLNNITAAASRDVSVTWKVQIGAQPDPLANRPWEIDKESDLDEVVHGRTKIENYVRRILRATQ